MIIALYLFFKRYCLELKKGKPSAVLLATATRVRQRQAARFALFNTPSSFKETLTFVAAAIRDHSCIHSPRVHVHSWRIVTPG